MRHELNMLGYVCPVPVFEARKKLLEMNSGEELVVICDDPDVQYDIPKLADRLLLNLVNVLEEKGVWKITLLVP